VEKGSIQHTRGLAPHDASAVIRKADARTRGRTTARRCMAGGLTFKTPVPPKT